jgi:putative ABC transport system permease protein
MLLRNVDEGVGVALDALRSNKLRSFLTILGVVIGVSTVMTMASIVDGIRTQIFNALNAASPNAFYVMRFFSQTPLNPDNLPYEVRIRPVLDDADAEAIARAPLIRHAALWSQSFNRIEHRGIRSQSIMVYGADDRYMELQGGSLVLGRFFTRAELGGREVIVLEEELSRRLFGSQNPLGQTVSAGDQAFQVIGVWRTPDNVFQPPGISVGVGSRRSSDGTSPGDGAALRRSRGLRPGAPNTFDFITQDQILDTISSLTSAFFLVMVAISSVALLVGGIGVMAIMMVSVTDRTREIGLRMACGATRREILWQFLVEAATLTLAGGIIGILLGLGTGQVLKLALGMESAPPLWSAVLAAAVSIGIGLTFGLLPANRAARMDPVDALRHE